MMRMSYWRLTPEDRRKLDRWVALWGAANDAKHVVSVWRESSEDGARLMATVFRTAHGRPMLKVERTAAATFRTAAATFDLEITGPLAESFPMVFGPGAGVTVNDREVTE